MTEELRDPESGLPVQEVKPGSAEDPFTVKNANPSEPASENPETAPVSPAPAGETPPSPPAPAEKSPAETPPAETPPEPAPAPAGPAVAPEPAPAPAAPAVSPEEEAAAVQRLDTFLKEQKEQAEAEIRRVQSAGDVRASRLEKRLEDSQGQIGDLTKEVREMRLEGLTDEQKEAARRAYEQQDRAGELDTRADELEAYHKDLMIASLLLEFKGVGVTADDLQGIDSPEEMESYCLRVQSAALQKKLDEGQPAPAAGAPAAPAPAAAPATPVPQGATAPSPAGGGGAPTPPKEMDKGQGPESMTKNLKDLPVETVKVQ